MIVWIRYLWGFYWSKENDILDSCQVLSRHESEILNDLDQRLSFLSARCFNQHFMWQMKDNIKRKPLGPGHYLSCTAPLSMSHKLRANNLIVRV